MRKICGIYKITSPTKKVYIGQSKNIEQRFKSYRGTKCRYQHGLRNSFEKYGVDRHKFEIIEECLPDELDLKEIYYIDLFQTFNSKYGLNLRHGGKNGKYSNESRIKISAASKGRKQSAETIEKRNKSREWYRHSEETKLKISKSHEGIGKGRKASDETKAKMSLIHTGKKRSEESRKKMSQAQKGRKGCVGFKHSEETKKRMSDARKGIKLSDETKQKLREINIGKKYSEETIKKRLETLNLNHPNRPKYFGANKGKEPKTNNNENTKNTN